MPYSSMAPNRVLYRREHLYEAPRDATLAEVMEEAECDRQRIARRRPARQPPANLTPGRKCLGRNGRWKPTNERGPGPWNIQKAREKPAWSNDTR